MENLYRIKTDVGESEPLTISRILSMCQSGDLQISSVFRCENSSTWMPITALVSDRYFKIESVDYFIKSESGENGPFTIMQLRSLWMNGKLTKLDQFRTNQAVEWSSLNDIMLDLETPEAEDVRPKITGPLDGGMSNADCDTPCKASSNSEQDNYGCAYTVKSFFKVFVIVCIIVVVVIIVAGLASLGQSDSTSSSTILSSGARRAEGSQASSSSHLAMPNEHLANSSDLRQAKEMLKNLPSACNRSFISISSDGTVNIRVLCSNANKQTDMVISIKDGNVSGLDGGTLIGR